MLFMVCVSMTASAQKAKITGTVRDLGGEPLIGVSVRADKTGQGVVTDIDGNYSIEVSSSGTLIFSYVGFETASEKVNGRKVIDVTMKEKSDILNEVVVIALWTRKNSPLPFPM